MARVRFYYPTLWRDASYRTRDGIVPFPLFALYASALGATLAFERVQHARAVAHAIAMSFAEKGGQLPEAVRADLIDAYLLPKD